RGLEGVVSKRASSTYLPGGRSHDWVKLKLRQREPFAIAGYSLGERWRSRLGSLVLGARHGDGLVYVGNVGSGLGVGDIDRLLELLAPLRREQPPLTRVPRDARLRAARVRWTEPRLRCLVEFTGWTTEGRLRAPTYKGLSDEEP